MENRVAQTEKELQKDLSKAEKRYRETKVANQLKLKKLEEEHEKRGRKLDEKKRAMNKELEKLQASHERKMKTLHNDLEETEESMASAKKVKASLGLAQAQVKRLTSEKSAIAAQLEDKRVEAKNLEDQNRLLESEVRQEKASTAKLKEDSAALQSELQASKDKMRLQLSDDENVQRLQKENSELEAKLQEVKLSRDEDLDRSKRDARKWEEELIKKTREAEKLTRKFDNAAKELECLKRRRSAGLGEDSAGKDQARGKMNLAALLKTGSNFKKSIRRRIQLGGLHEDVSGRTIAAFGSSAEADSSSRQDGGGSGSLNIDFNANGDAIGKVKLVISKMLGGEVQEAKRRSSAPPSGSVQELNAASNGSSFVNVSIPVPSIPSPAKEKQVQRLFPIPEREVYVASNGMDAHGTIVVNVNPSELLGDSMKLKRFLINASAEICRTLGVSSNVVTLSNPRSFPVLVDIVIVGNSASTADILLKLAGICRDDSSPLRRGGSGILARFIDLVPICSTSGSPSNSGSYTQADKAEKTEKELANANEELAQLKDEQKSMSRTINTLKANLQGYHDAKQQMNENLGNSVSESQAVKFQLLEMQGETRKLTADLKFAEDKSNLLEMRLVEVRFVCSFTESLQFGLVNLR